MTVFTAIVCGLLGSATCVIAGAGLAAPIEPADETKLKLGREVFLKVAEPQCAICHTLADAASVGKVGPNLNDLAPDAARVTAAVTGGIGVMPAFGDMLTADQIAAVSYYVAAVTRAGAK
jgi:mono/diheme cytochrome c family protein